MSGRTLILLLALSAPGVTLAQTSDPLNSTMWSFFQQNLLDGAEVQFDERVVLQAPPFAEDARQVPLQLDASAFQGQVERILLWAELNPIPRVVDFRPGERMKPTLAIRIRIEQATAIRAAVLTRDGIWHVGSTRIDAAGGGCTAPSVVRTQPGWEQHLGEVIGQRYPSGHGSRLRLKVSHPMDNGLTGGIPEFFLNHAELRAADGQVLGTLELFAAVGENPTISLETLADEPVELWLRDNNGNEFKADLR